MESGREFLGAVMGWVAGIASFILSISLAFYLGGLLLITSKAIAGYFGVVLALSSIIIIFGGAFIAICLSGLVGCFIYSVISGNWHLFG